LVGWVPRASLALPSAVRLITTDGYESLLRPDDEDDVAGLLLGLDTPTPGLHAVPLFDDFVARY
jgi:hypothetical protein